MTLTAENYFSPEADQYYIGSTQIKRFQECEAKALAVVRGEWKEEVTPAMLIGSYVDAHFSGTLDKFKEETPDIFTKSGELKADYQFAEYIIKRIERDEMFMRYLSGEKQKILTGEIEGIPVKVKIDDYHKDKVIVDLKVLKDFSPIWVPGQGHVNFVEYWGYDQQGAIYQEVERQNRNYSNTKLPFFLAAATKEKPEPDICIFAIPQERLDFCLEVVRSNIRRYAQIKKGEIPPTRCEKCDYCRATKKLTEVKVYWEE
jgi:hypothetical protein